MLTISPDNLLLPPASSALLQIQQLQKDDTYFSSFHHGQRLILLGFFGFFKSNIGQLLVLFSAIHVHPFSPSPSLYSWTCHCLVCTFTIKHLTAHQSV